MYESEKIKEQGEKKKAQNKRFLEKLKKTKPKNLDAVVHRLHEEAFEKIDCLECANCCKTTSPIFYQKDIERVAKRLKMKPAQFIEQYLHIDEDNDYVLNEAPCPFLLDDNTCMVYEDRPTACREYPHTNRKRMYQLMPLTFKNTMICPAVQEIVEGMKTKF